MTILVLPVSKDMEEKSKLTKKDIPEYLFSGSEMGLKGLVSSAWKGRRKIQIIC